MILTPLRIQFHDKLELVLIKRAATEGGGTILLHPSLFTRSWVGSRLRLSRPSASYQQTGDFPGARPAPTLTGGAGDVWLGGMGAILLLTAAACHVLDESHHGTASEGVGSAQLGSGSWASARAPGRSA